ncbi:MAG: YbdK family carboxylate-amine ligase [Mariprofundaceae bacterium]|nr:YbdK family carboxylate-amine ligase [Mariprofundaceae bacterium]
MPPEQINSFPFKPSDHGSTGVEMEWITVDSTSGAQVPLAPGLLNSLPATPRIKQELFTSTIEINTGIHHRTASCMDELATLRTRTLQLLTPMGGALLSSGTHPFSRWRDQIVSDDPRYHRLLERLQWMAHRFNIFGIHVHIGMPDGDSCIHTMNQLLPIMPLFLAISANSPFWQGDDTGLCSSRVKIFEGLSQGGMPFYFRNWQDFEHCAGRLMATGSIDSVRDIWWEMRPHPDFGTLEIRIGDMPATRADTAAYIAYVRSEAMVATNSEPPAVRVHPSLIRENRWRACRYGVQADIIDPVTEEPVALLLWLGRRVEWLAKHGADPDDLAVVEQRLQAWQQYGDGASRQRGMFRQSGDLGTVVRRMYQEDGWD